MEMHFFILYDLKFDLQIVLNGKYFNFKIILPTQGFLEIHMCDFQ